MRDDLILIVVVLDASGSMASIKDGVLDGMNEFINAQRELPDEVIFSMIQFDSGWDWQGNVSNSSLRYKEIYDFRNLKEVKPLTNENYVPAGGTPLIAAMCTAIDSVGAKLAAIPEKDRPSKVVFVTMTDGQENSSDAHKYSKELLKEKIKHQQEKYDWQFMFLGAQQDSFAEAGGLGYMAKATANFVNTYAGTVSALNMASASITSYRSGKSDDIDLTSIVEQSTVKSD